MTSAGAGLRVAVLQHEPQTGLGAFSGLLDEAGVDYEVLETGWASPLPDIGWFDGAIVLGGSVGAHDVPGYQDLLERTGVELRDVMSALEVARPELDALAGHLIEAWLFLVAGAAAVHERRSRVAV